jgi:DNA primase
VRYPPAVLEEIRARLPVSAVVGRKVLLKKAGREWKGLSPFNAEKSPSFFVNDQKGFYHCFSSGRHGDIFTFLMETEGLPFPEAVERLAAEAGVPLPKATREAQAQEETRKSLYDVMELAAVFFETSLHGRAGLKAREYLDRRSLRADTQQAFRLGYAPPDRYALRDHLAAKNVSREMMIEAGLLIAGEDVSVPYDRFRDRVMFPIADAKGRIVAFGGRALNPDAPAKYLNSPDTPLFNKGRLLYNLHNARAATHTRGTVIAVEGYIDVIAMSASGFPNTVAPLGTALTEEQLTLLWRLADEPILCFDGDAAGRRAAFRAVDVALPMLAPGKSLRFALLPEGQDPDDLVRSGSSAALRTVLDGARPLVDILWTREIEAGPLDTPERRAALERRLREVLGLIRDDMLKRYYREEIQTRLRALHPVPPPNRRFGRERCPYARDQRGARSIALDASLRASPALARSMLFVGVLGASPREAFILSILVAHPALLQVHAEMLADMEFSSRDLDALRSVLLDCAGHPEALDPAYVRARLERANLIQATERLADRVRPGDRWALDPHADRMRLEDALHQAIILHRKAHTLHSELRAAERALAEEGGEMNLEWLREVQSQLFSIEGAEADPDDGFMAR